MARKKQSPKILSPRKGQYLAGGRSTISETKFHSEHIQVLPYSLLTMVESNACSVKQPSECFEAELKILLSRPSFRLSECFTGILSKAGAGFSSLNSFQIKQSSPVKEAGTRHN